MLRLPAFLLTILLAALIHAQDFTPYELHYEAETLGLTAEASRYLWQLESGELMLRNKIEAAPLGVTLAKLDERSRFRIVEGSLQNLEYSLVQTGLGAQEERARFNWENLTVSTSYEEQQSVLTLSQELTDKLLFQYELRRAILAGKTGPFEFSVVDEGEVETQQFSIIGEEDIDTPAGRFSAVKLVRNRDDDSPRSTVFWLARDWEYLLIAIDQIDGSGRKTELRLREGLLGSSRLVGLAD